MAIGAIILFDNREWWYYNEIAIKYCNQKFYNIGPWFHVEPPPIMQPFKLRRNTLGPLHEINSDSEKWRDRTKLRVILRYSVISKRHIQNILKIV
jgi:hypothetical protein